MVMESFRYTGRVFVEILESTGTTKGSEPAPSQAREV